MKNKNNSHENQSRPHSIDERKSGKHAGMNQRTNIKVGSSLGDFWKKLKGLYPG